MVPNQLNSLNSPVNKIINAIQNSATTFAQYKEQAVTSPNFIMFRLRLKSIIMEWSHSQAVAFKKIEEVEQELKAANSPQAFEQVSTKAFQDVFPLNQSPIAFKNFKLELQEAHDKEAVAAVLKNVYNLISEKNIFPDIEFHNLVMMKLDEVGAWTILRRYFSALRMAALVNQATYQIMFGMASIHTNRNLVINLYIEANENNFASIVMHSGMMAMAAALKDIHLARMIFELAFATNDAVKGNFANTTTLNDAHVQMLTIAKECHDLDLARKVYWHAMVHMKPERIPHKLMIDFLVEEGFFKEAMHYGEKRFNLNPKIVQGLVEVNLSGQSYGTAYVAMMELLQSTKKDMTFALVPSKTPKEKQLIDRVVNALKQHYDKDIRLQETHRRESHYQEFQFKPHKLRGNAPTFTPRGSINQSIFGTEAPDQSKTSKEEHSKKHGTKHRKSP